MLITTAINEMIDKPKQTTSLYLNRFITNTERKNFIVRDEKVGIKVKKKLPFRYSPHKDIFEINGPTFGTTSPAFYVPHPRPKRTPKEIEESKLRRMEKNRINVKNWYTRHGLHLGKIGRPKKV